MEFAVTSCGGTLHPDSATQTPSDGGFCPLDDSASLASNGNGHDQVAASGSAEGDSVDCTFCGIGVRVATSTDPNVTTLYIKPGVSNTASSCSTPENASNVWFAGELVISAAKPGVYSSSSVSGSDNAYCDGLTVSYDLPYEGGTVDCGDSGYLVGPGSCPEGCISLCMGDGGEGGVLCSPCVSAQSQPETTLMTYGLEDGCDDARPQLGSWTVTLTSVVPAVVPADAGVPPGVVDYTAHGSLTATLFHDENAPSPSVTVTLAF